MESVFSMHEALVDPQHEENWEEVRSRSGERGYFLHTARMQE